MPQVEAPVIFTLAGDHGVAIEGVSAYPQAVTAQMVENFARGGAGVNVLARHVGARVVVANLGVAAPLADHAAIVDRSVAPGTRSITKGPGDDPRRGRPGDRGGRGARGRRSAGLRRDGGDGHRQHDRGERAHGGAAPAPIRR